jgi:indolepyruvate ferredoxin oxidoreductase beta subunit
MAQRGGSVVAQIRFGREVFSPLVPRKSAQVLCSLERIEGLRNIDYLADGGLAVISSQKIVPVTASVGGVTYPDIDEELLLRYFPRLVYIDAVEQATEMGNPKVANTILLGAMATQLTLPTDAWLEAIKQSVKEKFVDINIKAFQHGFTIGESKYNNYTSTI